MLTFDENKASTSRNVELNNASLFTKITTTNSFKNNLIMEKFSIFKESLSSVLTESTAHGIGNLFKEKNLPIKILWSILFVGGAVAAIYCKNFKIKKINQSEKMKSKLFYW